MSNHVAIIELAKDITNGTLGNYSKDEANQKLREALNKLTGSEDGKFNVKKFRRNKIDVFEIIEEVVDARIEADVREKFKEFVDYRSVAFGDKLEFKPQSDQLFEVAKIAAGTNNLRRQRIEQGEAYRIDTDWNGVKIAEDLERFLAGHVDWTDLIDRVERSFEAEITELIFDAVTAAYSSLESPYVHRGVWDIDEFNLLIENVQAATGSMPMVLGTRAAIAKATPAYISDSMKDQRNSDGYFKVVDGITFGVIPQGYKRGTTDFVMSPDTLLVIPNGSEKDRKFIKFVMEGESLIKDVSGQANADDSMEYTLRKKYGVAAEKSKVFGAYIFA